MENEEWNCRAMERDGLVLKVTIKQATVDWANVVVLLDVTNISDKKITYGYSSALRGFTVALSNKESRPVRFTKDGERLLKDDDQKVTKYATKDLEPDDTITVKIELGKYFEPDKSGDYTLSVLWSQNRSGEQGTTLELKNIPIAVRLGPK